MITNNNWRLSFPKSDNNISSLQRELSKNLDQSIYHESIQVVEKNLFFMVQENSERKLIIVGNSDLGATFNGTTEQINQFQVKVCPLTTENRKSLQAIFSWTLPQACGPNGASIGLGDRLGLASPGHIATVKQREITPILAQQSIRELDLTGRDYTQVLDAAAWAVFQTGYDQGYGADGDHLKKLSDVKKALDLGFSMITLDCSEHINDSVSELSETEINAQYDLVDSTIRTELEKTYLDQEFILKGGSKIRFTDGTFKQMVLIYVNALNFVEKVYHEIIATAGRNIDFEVSIDEVATPTSPQDHFFVANELTKKHVKFNSVAPRFVGEFQKGIDYIGDPVQFETEFKIHAEIADHFGYKVSIHSGSDKFEVFGIIGKYTRGRFHIKTAGTNWLEAVRVIAETDPDLYREMHRFALDNLDEARKYYVVTFNEDDIPNLETVSDQRLPELMDQDAPRQAIHITYGLLLEAKNESGESRFKKRFYQVLTANQSKYSQRLQAHIGKHLDLLGVK